MPATLVMPINHDPESSPSISRRRLLGATAKTAALSVVNTGGTDGAAPVPLAADPREPIAVALLVNGNRYSLRLDPRTTLLDALREHAGLTGTKKGCDHGQCGACTVHLNGKRALSCLMLAATAQHYAVATIEGLVAAYGTLHPMQQAFVDNDALQCGYCTPGQIMSAIACVQERHAENDDQIRESMSGNLCRCAAYPNIVAAVRQGKRQMENSTHASIHVHSRLDS